MFFSGSKASAPTNICRLSIARAKVRRCVSRSLALWAGWINSKASGQLEALMRSGLRHCEKFALIDAHAAGETEPVRVLRIGPELVFGRLWQESGIHVFSASTPKQESSLAQNQNLYTP